MSLWRIILTPSNRPFALMNLEPGSGLTDREPPDGMVEHIEAMPGAFDQHACMSASDFAAVAYRDLQWPPPQL